MLLGSVMLCVEKRHEIKYKRAVFSFDFLDVQYREHIFRFIDLHTLVHLKFERLRIIYCSIIRGRCCIIMFEELFLVADFNFQVDLSDVI